MAEIKVTPSELRRVGSRITGGSPEIQALRGEIQGVGGKVAEPVATASALDDLATQWGSGVERLAEDVAALGGLTTVAASQYEQTEGRAMGGGG